MDKNSEGCYEGAICSGSETAAVGSGPAGFAWLSCGTRIGAALGLAILGAGGNDGGASCLKLLLTRTITWCNGLDVGWFRLIR